MYFCILLCLPICLHIKTPTSLFVDYILGDSEKNYLSNLQHTEDVI